AGGRDGRRVVAGPSKGRMAQPALGLRAAAGLRFELGERALQDGPVHAGITGANLVAEAEADVVTLAGLGFARCTLEATVPSSAPQRRARTSRGPARRDRVSALERRRPPGRARGCAPRSSGSAPRSSGWS